MRKLIVSMNVTLDGFMSGPNCELDWHFKCWTKEMAESLYSQLSMADTILLGSTTYKAMAKFWPSKAKDLSFPREDIVFADMMNSYKKFVFSTSLIKPEWNNSEFLSGDLLHEVRKLKKAAGKDMIIYGSGNIVQSLTRSGLIDEYQLWVHPIILGNGKPLFKTAERSFPLNLYKTKNFDSGVVLLYYQQTRVKNET